MQWKPSDVNLTFDLRRSDAPFVDSIWRTQTESDGTFISAAAIHCGMVVTKYEGETTITMRGPETKATDAAYPPGCEFFGIVFKLGTFMPHLPAVRLLNRNDVNLPLASSNSFWLQGAAWQIPTYENVDTFVDRLVSTGLLVHDPVVDAAIQSDSYDLSLRSVQYRFMQATGLTQSEIRQIERAKRAHTLLQQGVPILDTVFDLGYYDQPHLTRALKRFTGQTPAQIARALQSA